MEKTDGSGVAGGPPPIPKLRSRPKWLRWVGLICAFLVARVAVLTVTSSDQPLVDRQEAFNQGAIRFVVAFIVVSALFEVIARVFVWRRWAGITLLAVTFASPVIFVGGWIFHNEAHLTAVPPIQDPFQPASLSFQAMDAQYQREHPMLQYGGNAAIFERKMLTILIDEPKSTDVGVQMHTYRDLMDRAYADAQRDHRWVTPP